MDLISKLFKRYKLPTCFMCQQKLSKGDQYTELAYGGGGGSVTGKVTLCHKCSIDFFGEDNDNTI